MTKVLLFGLDGATFTILDHLVERGIMPFFGRVMSEGARGVLSSTTPPLTPLAWTSLVTGRTPGHHGITGFFQHASPEAPYVRMVSGRQLGAETIWSMLSRHGRRSASLNFIVHNPPPRIDGFVIPGWVTWRWLRRESHPKGSIDRLAGAVEGFDLKKLAMDFQQEKKAVAGAAIDDYDSWILLHTERERQWFNVLEYLWKNEPCDLAGVVFDGVDKLQHLLWRYLDPALEPEKPSQEFVNIRALCWQYFAQLDRFLEEAVRFAGPETMTLIASDHGFTGTRDILYINTWLEQQGYLTWRPETQVHAEASNELGEGVPYHLTAFDMANTRAFASTASSNGIHIQVNRNGSQGGVAPLQYEEFRRELTDALLNRCVHPETGRPLVSKVWTREEVFAGPAMEKAPDLTLRLHDHGFVSVFRSNSIYKQRPSAMGTHHPDGILVAYGAGVRSQTRFDPIQMVDVAPTILYAVGVPVPEDLEGQVARDVFAPEFLSANAIQRGKPTAAVRPRGGSMGSGSSEPDDDPQILSRLRALGYLE